MTAERFGAIQTAIGAEREAGPQGDVGDVGDAQLAGAPDDPAAGIVLHVRLGDGVVAGAPLVTVHAQAPGQLAYALDYAAANPDIFEIEA